MTSGAGLRVGAAVVDVTPALGIEMAGYGARQGVSTGIHDPIQVRTVVLDDGATQLVLAVCDLVGVGPDLVTRARELVEQECGIPPANVMVAATHTHSGPAGLRVQDGVDARDNIGVTARKICGSVQLARSRLERADLKLATVEVSTISQNRRHPDGPIETTAKVLLAAPPGGGPVVATLVSYACHATVLEYDNMEYSADFPGAMARSVERSLGGVAVYLQGAAGNINPVWMRHDFDEVDRIGGILGAAAARAAHELRPLGEGQWCVNLNWSEETPKEPAPGTVLHGVSLGATQSFVDLPRRAFADQEAIGRELEEVRSELAGLGEGDIGRRHRLTARRNQLSMEWVISSRLAAKAPRPSHRAEVQALRLSDECAIVTLPGEFFVETGREIERAVGLPHLLVAGYANDYISYVPTAEAFPEAGYEVGCAQFEPEAAGLFTEAAVKAVQSLYG